MAELSFTGRRTGGGGRLQSRPHPDGRRDLPVSAPISMGGPGAGSNPEELLLRDSPGSREPGSGWSGRNPP